MSKMCIFMCFLSSLQNGLLEEDDLDAFIAKILNYLNIEKESKRYHRLQDVKNSFWDCIKDQLIREYKGDLLTCCICFKKIYITPYFTAILFAFRS